MQPDENIEKARKKVTSLALSYDIEKLYTIYRRHHGIILRMIDEIKEGLAKPETANNYRQLPTDRNIIAKTIKYHFFENRIHEELMAVEQANNEIVQIQQKDFLKDTYKLKEKTFKTISKLIQAVDNSIDENIDAESSKYYMNAIKEGYNMIKVELNEPTQIQSNRNINLSGTLDEVVVKDDVKKEPTEVIDAQLDEALKNNPIENADSFTN